MADPARARKMADRIKEIVAKRLDKGLRDPRLGFVTITDVRVTGDLQHASIFYTVYGSEAERKDSARALTAATGMLRSEVGRNITARLTPSLEFIPDAIPENAEHIESLLREARTRDAEVTVLASNAEFAGEPDPYVKPRDLDDDDDFDDEALEDLEGSEDDGEDLGDHAELGGPR
ncbi:30S ribosome-binding factor RbfA [Agromyces albus]|jgi:ribosome-binding factor A|uniref:Ribosome-binding factor A n=1 Tax=Agromyces albus TaxID=205332 RepID=A0A4Q2KTN1_9MICO|nr:30S ribosome-binding factor RbfA [Agromyces albus]MDQ0574863.1 ribosome-binding factor A [Agromyces albus]RXZ68884.1 30S ribosome-binding factor RbfA [Agromyces albus]